ncbi:hypothetical protein BIT28_07410 [Photobacterium proteolyticum]|uniref:AAA+ ATPase domain-containing protein n=1 Tax=Photobacterium proteolyticum TaxID=1903952 RepID=A0A1Q9GS34_9GAMM|nr:AAA family ATPase [Photobacterium proteolyticum]OLQ77460.1 hypothetical protein BIT28_07410 [Photobacterium proteolyticum]
MNVDNLKLTSDFTVFIGENGCGKSEILNQLSQRYVDNGQHVIAIAHCIHDKFDSALNKKKNFNFIGARYGSEMTKIALKEVLKTFSDSNKSNKSSKSNFSLSQIFEYVGYQPTVGLSFEINYDNIESLSITLSRLNRSEMRHSNVRDLIKAYVSSSKNSELIWIDFSYKNFSSLANTRYLELLKYEDELTSLGIIKKTNYFLIKRNRVINLDGASSGELYQIANISYIASKIKKNSIILIDEPENSLHPKWQKEYISKLFSFFSLYRPKFVLATHSPLMISSLDIDNKYTDYNINTSVYRVENFSINKIDHESTNVEGILWDMFNVITPENRFLSNLLVNLMNDLNDRMVTRKYVLDCIEKLSSNTSDERQLSALQEVRNIVLHSGVGL